MDAVGRILAEPLAALNTMLFEDGLLLDVPDGTDGGAATTGGVTDSARREPAGT